MSRGKKNMIYHLMALAVVAIWGVTFISTKIILKEGISPSQIFFIRFLLAYIGLIFIDLTVNKGKLKLFCKSARDELFMAVVGISGGSFYFLAENTALEYTQACNVSFMVSTSPLLTALLTMAVKRTFKGKFVRELQDIRMNAWLAIGTIFVFVGMAMVIFDGAGIHLAVRGDLLALGASACWAVYSIFAGQMTNRYGSAFTTRKSFFYGLVTIIPFMIAEERTLDTSVLMKSSVLVNLLFLGLVASLGCYLVWNVVISKIGNVTATNYIYLNPLFTLIAGIIILGEEMTPLAAVGSAAILIGVSLSGRNG